MEMPAWNSCGSSQKGERSNGIQQTRCMVKGFVRKGHSQEWFEREIPEGARALPISTDTLMAFWTGAALQPGQQERRNEKEKTN